MSDRAQMGDNGGPTTAFRNDFLRDDRIGHDTRGMLLRLISLPKSHEITVETIIEGGTAGRDKVYRMLKEAEDYGYLVREMRRPDGAKFGKQIYRVTDDPFSIEIKQTVKASDVYGRGKIPMATRRAVYERDGYACLKCGSTAKLSLDHIIPVSSGGDESPENLRTLCLDCNLKKGASNEGARGC